MSFEKIFGYTPHTFWELKKLYCKSKYSLIKGICDKEVKDLSQYYKFLLQKKGVGIFRTAINAETLYYLRKKAKCIKVVPLIINKNNRKINVLVIRDQIQGYYTNEWIKVKNKKVSVASVFSENNFRLLVDFYKQIVKKFKFSSHTLFFIYKFHLMGVELQKMIDKAVKNSGVRAKYTIYQPDSGLHLLLDDIFKKKINNAVIICGNEVGDTLLETLIHYYDIGTKETFFTSNFMLGFKELEVLQTMHGSADDIAGKKIVNPFATLKLSAYALEKWLKIPNAVCNMEKLINKAVKTKNITKDMGGNRKTKEVVDYILCNWK